MLLVIIIIRTQLLDYQKKWPYFAKTAECTKMPLPFVAYIQKMCKLLFTVFRVLFQIQVNGFSHNVS